MQLLYKKLTNIDKLNIILLDDKLKNGKSTKYQSYFRPVKPN